MFLLSVSLFVRAEWSDDQIVNLIYAVNTLNSSIDAIERSTTTPGVIFTGDNPQSLLNAANTVVNGSTTISKFLASILANERITRVYLSNLTNQLSNLDRIEEHVESGNATMSEIYTLLNDSNITGLVSSVSQIKSDVHNINSRLVGAIQTSLYDIKANTGQSAGYARMITEYLQNTEYRNSTNTLYQLILLNEKFSSILPLVDSTQSTVENFYIDFLSYRDSLFNRLDTIIGLLRDLKGQGDESHEYYSGIATSFEDFLFYATNHGSGSCNYDFSDWQPYLFKFNTWYDTYMDEPLLQGYADYESSGASSSKPSFLQWNTLTNSRTNFVYASPSYWQTTTGNYFVDVIKSFSNLYFLNEQQIKGGIVVHEDVVRCERLLVSVTNRVDNIQTNLVYSLRALQALAHATTNKMDEVQQAYDEEKSSTEEALENIKSFEDQSSFDMDDGSSIVNASSAFWDSLPKGDTLPEQVGFVSATTSTDGKGVMATVEYVDITRFRWLFNTFRIIATVISWAVLVGFVISCWMGISKLWAFLSKVAYGSDA